jgi:predicted nucleic acid-binding protein
VSEAFVVIADAGPIIALSFVEQLDLLQSLFQRVVVPEEVAAELARGRGRRHHLCAGRALGAADRR